MVVGGWGEGLILFCKQEGSKELLHSNYFWTLHLEATWKKAQGTPVKERGAAGSEIRKADLK